MNWFFIRIVLHRCNDYGPLHKVLEDAGLQREIDGDNGRTYDLPDATYWYVGRETDPAVVRDILQRIIRSVWVDHYVIVVRTDALAWSGLNPR